MPILIPKIEAAYFPMHKCANTSVKEALFVIENGFPASAVTVCGKPAGIHTFYKTNRAYFSKLADDKADAFWKFAIVREPVSRFVSFFTQKILGDKLLKRPKSKSKVKALGLSSDPTVSDFINDWEGYRSVHPQIDTHTETLQRFLGDSPEYFDRIFNMGELGELEAELTRRARMPVSLPHSNSGGKSLELSAKEETWVREHFASDYEIFGRHF